MARTTGSGWGGGPLNYQRCPTCGKKKAYYNPKEWIPSFKCTFCKNRFDSTELERKTYK